MMLGKVAGKATSDLWNSQDGSPLCVCKILVQHKVLVFETSRGVRHWLLSEVAAGGELKCYWMPNFKQLKGAAGVTFTSLHLDTGM